MIEFEGNQGFQQDARKIAFYRKKKLRSRLNSFVSNVLDHTMHSHDFTRRPRKPLCERENEVRKLQSSNPERGGAETASSSPQGE